MSLSVEFNVSNEFDVVILGSGPAGCSASVYAARSGLNTLMITGREKGGQLTTTTEVENYPGFKTILGTELMEKMIEHAEYFGVKTIATDIERVNFSCKPFLLHDDNSATYSARSVIIATGATAKWLNIESEQNFRGFGVSACATCDGFFFKNKNVLVVGGGNSAVEEALFLTNYASKVIVIHRRDKFRAEQILQNRLFANEKIEVIWNTELLNVNGTEEPVKKVTSVNVVNNVTNIESKIDVSGVFIAVGHAPNTNLFKNYLDCDNEGYIITKADSTKTNLPGVFAAGDVQDRVFRQAITAAGTGCMAALEAQKFLSNLT